MAKYNREFLVPYLENLCALHIAKWKIDQKKSEISRNLRQNTQNIKSLEEPEEPCYEDTGFKTFGLILGIILVIVSMLDIFIISLLAGVIGWFFVIGYGYFLYDAHRQNEDREQAYYVAAKEYNEKLAALKTNEDDYNTYAFVQFSMHQAETEKVDEALSVAYNANVIPRRYRDIYVAVYLYDWFSTSMSDDLDMALNMYVLEEIKDRLDNIIDMLSKSLINQKLIIANQQKSMEQQRQYRDQMMDKLDRMQVTAEEQTRYLGMIEANTAAAAYFSAAEYVRKM